MRAASEHAGRLRRATDSLIAEIAVTHNLTLATHNTHNFLGMADLKIENCFGAESASG